MTSLVPSVPKQRHWRPLLRFSKYVILGGLANMAIMGSTAHYLKTTKPTFTSHVLLNVAGGGPGVNLNVPDIGSAVTSSKSSFASSSSDPRENYKEIVMGATVINAAAEMAEMSPKEFGKPRANIVANTTLMSLEMTALSGETAREKLMVLHKALAARLDVLRTGEQVERDKATAKALQAAQVKLTAAQRRVSAYKARSGLKSAEQIKDLISNIEQLRQKRSQTVAMFEQNRDRKQRLATTLNITPRTAADTLALQADQEFQKSLAAYTDATTTLVSLLPARGPKYPDVVAAKSDQAAALNNLMQRGKTLLGRPLKPDAVKRLVIDSTNASADGSGGNRSELFKDLIETDSDGQGLKGEIKGLTQEIAALEDRLRSLSQKESVLENLLRDLNIAEAVFASTLAKIDLSKGDPFASYPVMQLVEEPTLPTEPSAPKKGLVKIGAVMGAFLITLGLTLIWYRQPMLKASQRLIQGIIE